MKEIQAFNYIPFFKAFNMNKVFINEPLSFEIWIALMLAQQPIEDSLKALKISNLENLISKILSISSKSCQR